MALELRSDDEPGGVGNDWSNAEIGGSTQID